MELQIYKAQIDPNPTSELEVNFIGLVDRPAIERNFQAFKAQEKKAAFILNEEKHIISGPAMIADMPLYRKDDQLGEYYVVFDKPSINSIVEKFSAKGYLKNFNLFHDDQQQVSDVVIFNSFISDAELGIAPMKGFEDVPDGSWFISAKVNNPAVWEKVKAGEIKGFSIEGLFSYIPVKQQMATSLDLTEEDVEFLSEMIPHYECALQAAVVIGSDSKIYAFAQAIIKNQSADILQMKQWLGDGYVSMKLSADKAYDRISAIMKRVEL